MQNLNAENTKNPSNSSILMRGKLVDLSTPHVMGIINVTPDSFYPESRHSSVSNLLSTVEKMQRDGAMFVDIGGYSSRPGAENVPITEEIHRIKNAVIEIHRHFPELYLSIDTFRAEVAKVGLENGVDIINDISGFSIDETILDVVSEYKSPYILMHMKGTPKTMQQEAIYTNIFNEMILYFSEKIAVLHSKGIHDIILDPGFGFSKTIDQNYFLLEHLESFQILNKPILAGISRKSMIYKRINSTPDSKETLDGTIALNKIALQKGATILRVHDVKEAVDLIK